MCKALQSARMKKLPSVLLFLIAFSLPALAHHIKPNPDDHHVHKVKLKKPMHLKAPKHSSSH